jgi:hypothetical protein
MRYLVEIAPGMTALESADVLRDAFVRIATEAVEFIERQTEGSLLRDDALFDSIRKRVDYRFAHIGNWQHPSGKLFVNGGKWDRSEVEATLRQIEVIVLALRTEQLRAATNLQVNPTQEPGFDADGLVQGNRWVLEANGEVKASIKSHLAENGKKLCAAKDCQLRFYACRPFAWRSRESEYAVPTGKFKLVNNPARDDVCLFEFLRTDNNIH